MVNKARRLSGINTLAYMGIEPTTASLLIVSNRIPTPDDRVGNQIGAYWVLEETNLAPARVFTLVRLQGSGSGGATWYELASGGTGFVNEFDTDSGSAFPVANIINIIGGTSTGGAGTNMNTRGAGNTVEVNLNNSIFQPDTNASGSEGLYALGAHPFLHNFGTQNTWVGESAGGDLTLTTAQDDVGVGYHALFNNIVGNQSVAVGSQSLLNTNASDNIGIGYQANMANVAGLRSVAIGTQSLLNNTASDNISIGYRANQANIAGISTIAIGSLALTSNLSSNNLAIGSNAANAITTGTPILALGHNSLHNAIASTNVIALGENSAYSMAAGDRVIAIGNNSLQDSTVGDNVAIGNNAMANCTTGIHNVVVGERCWDTGIGTGNDNYIIGYQSFRDNTSGHDNIGIGDVVLEANTTGSANIGIGEACLRVCNADNNIAIGIASQSVSTSGSGNCSLGVQSLNALLTGTNNVSLGFNSGTAYTGAESSNILVGAAVTGTVGDSNTTRIGVGASQTHCFIAGIRGRTTGVADAIAVLVDSAHQLGTVSSSRRYKDDIQDMDQSSNALMKLRPVTFHYKEDPEKRLQYGLIAEEVEEHMPRLVAYDENGEVYTVRYNELPAILLNELQKLSKRVQSLEKNCATCAKCVH